MAGSSGRGIRSGRAAYSGRPARHSFQDVRRHGRIRWWLRTATLFAILGVMRLAGSVRRHPRRAVSLAGTVITLTGISLPSEAVLISGFLVQLLALFMPSEPAEASAGPCAHRLSATPFMPRVPPVN